MKLKSIFPISALFLSQIYFAQETPKKESDTKEKQIPACRLKSGYANMHNNRFFQNNLC